MITRGFGHGFSVIARGLASRFARIMKLLVGARGALEIIVGSRVPVLLAGGSRRIYSMLVGSRVGMLLDSGSKVFVSTVVGSSVGGMQMSVGSMVALQMTVGSEVADGLS